MEVVRAYQPSTNSMGYTLNKPTPFSASKSLANPNQDQSQIAGSTGFIGYAPMYLWYSFSGLTTSVEELETAALERLKLLKLGFMAKNNANGGAGASSAGNGGNGCILTEDVMDALRKGEVKYGLDVHYRLAQDQRLERILKDEAGHFVLRLALCKTQETRQWILARECELFGTRLRTAGVDVALKSLKNQTHINVIENAPDIQELTEREKSEMLPELEQVFGTYRSNAAGGPQRKYYRVPFTEVLHLVAKRRVLLKRGTAYISEFYIHDILVSQFRSRLSQALNLMARSLYAVEAHPVMGPLLQLVRAHQAAIDSNSLMNGKSKLNNADKDDLIGLQQVDSSISRMPLCMQVLMFKLKENHHLRYQGRLQLGVFLKGCGLTMEDSLRYWRAEFGKGGVTSEKFDKEYSYNIRHHYGKEGKRKNLSPFNCMQIINKQPGPGEYHGCPYRELKDDALIALLLKNKVSLSDAKKIATKASESHFQIACGMAFTAIFDKEGDGSRKVAALNFELGQEYVTSHPNEYFIHAGQMLRHQGAGSSRSATEGGEEIIQPQACDAEAVPAANAEEPEPAAAAAAVAMDRTPESAAPAN